MDEKNKVLFLSDLHLFHDKILEFEKPYRPFSSVHEQNDYLINKWNSKVKPLDKIIILGDVFLLGSENLEGYNSKVLGVRDILGSKLNGKKILVGGNHDIGPPKWEIIKDVFSEVLGVYTFKRALCTHIPIHPCSFGKYKYNFHGHLHSKRVQLDTMAGGYIDDKRYINVSVELQDFTPKTYEELTNEQGEPS